VLDGLTNAEIEVAESLDGSMDIKTLYAVSAAAGVSAGRVSALIATLHEHHLLVDSPLSDSKLVGSKLVGSQQSENQLVDRATGRARLYPMGERRDYLLRPDASAIAAAYNLSGDGYHRVAARSTRHVVISGDGDLPCALADLLRAGGTGRVSVGTSAVDAIDLELRSQRAGRLASTSGSVTDLPVRPDLVVLAAVGAIRPDAGEPWLRRGIPHLPLVVQGHRVQVGPLITGGDGPCLSCMDLHRRDRDPAWPALLAQLVPGWPLRPGPPINLESTLAAMTIGVAAMLVHTCLDEEPVPNDLSLELSLPWPAILSRRWFRHPVCACTAEHATMTG